MRARTRVELADALAVRNVPAQAAERVLDRLTAVGLVDDAAFAAEFVASRRSARGLAGREIGRQLRDKGVSEELVVQALTPVDREAELQSAHELVSRRRRAIRHLPPEVQTRRLVGLLARKGYSSEMSYQVVRSALDAPYDFLPDGDTL